jgi:hypothetical protein
LEYIHRFGEREHDNVGPREARGDLILRDVLDPGTSELFGNPSGDGLVHTPKRVIAAVTPFESQGFRLATTDAHDRSQPTGTRFEIQNLHFDGR